MVLPTDQCLLGENMKYYVGSILASTLFPAWVHAACIDLSGTYSSPFNTSDLQITYTVSQSKCDWISVTSIVYQGGISTTSATYTLDGVPARNCLLDAFNSCGSLKLKADGIEKHDPQNNIANDEQHGACEFKLSVLTKDPKGNLVEAIESAECEDGYKGKIKSRLYPKKIMVRIL